MLNNNPSKSPEAAPGNVSASRSSIAPVSLDLSCHEFGCGGPDTYLSTLIAESLQVAEAPEASKHALPHRSWQPKFDPWEHPED